uniref:Cyclic nucleotide-binding domain-containing protein n=1 Tax=Macrostomum lignano TaxID=282301 RepID=A0A1I8FFL6_9PLAT
MSIVDAVVRCHVHHRYIHHINFRTTYVNSNDEVVCKPSWFIIDLLAALPFDLMLIGFEAGSDETTTLVGLFKTRTAAPLGPAHWLACIWYAIGNLEQSDEQLVGWLAYTGRSVGFGNISPNTNSEKVFSIFVMMIGSLMYASISAMSPPSSSDCTAAAPGTRAPDAGQGVCPGSTRSPAPLRNRLEEFFQHNWARTNGIDMDLVLRASPTPVPVVCARWQPEFARSNAPPGDVILHRGELLSSLYFVSCGSLEVLDESESLLAILDAGDAFGELPGAADCRPVRPPVAAASPSERWRTASCTVWRRRSPRDIRGLSEFAAGFAAELDVGFSLRRPACPHGKPSARGGEGGGSASGSGSDGGDSREVGEATTARLAAVEGLLGRLEARVSRLLQELEDARVRLETVPRRLAVSFMAAYMYLDWLKRPEAGRVEKLRTGDSLAARATPDLRDANGTLKPEPEQCFQSKYLYYRDLWTTSGP